VCLFFGCNFRLTGGAPAICDRGNVVAVLRGITFQLLDGKRAVTLRAVERMIEQIPASNADVERLSEVVHKGLFASIAKLLLDDEQKILRPAQKVRMASSPKVA
jgi:hypothetical protein